MDLNVNLIKYDWIALLATTLGLLGLVVAGWFVAGTPGVGIILILGIGIVLFMLLENRREIFQNRQQNRQQFEQTEALFGLYFSLSGILLPLPETKGWSANADLLRLIYKKIRREEPNLVVELGSGSSTIIGGYALQQNGSGCLVSLEHLEEHASQSRRMISFYNLGDYSRVLEAPLIDYTLNGENWKWYSLENFDPEEPIDLVVVDGPPGSLQDLSRYPAFPLLKEWLSKETTFIIDDGDREDERNMVGKWLREDSSATSEYRDVKGGAYILDINDK